eukprot:6716037-Alexandrium_andersonii.AAC.1
MGAGPPELAHTHQTRTSADNWAARALTHAMQQVRGQMSTHVCQARHQPARTPTANADTENM